MVREDSLSDIILAERLVKLETIVCELKQTLEKMDNRNSNLFFRYGWPMVQILIWIAIVMVARSSGLG